MKCLGAVDLSETTESPSMRREWIEMPLGEKFGEKIGSPSMRREWIEMTESSFPAPAQVVSLHAEGVD